VQDAPQIQKRVQAGKKKHHMPALAVPESGGVQGILANFESSISALNSRIKNNPSPADNTPSFQQQSDLITMQRRTVLSDAQTDFKENYENRLSSRDGLKVIFALTQRPGVAEMYLHLNERQKSIFIEDILEKAIET
jgi:hypothetical protein